MTEKNVFIGEPVQNRAKKKQSIGIKSFCSNTSYGFEYKKNCISNLSIKMFIKRKNRAGQAYANRMLLT